MTDHESPEELNRRHLFQALAAGAAVSGVIGSPVLAQQPPAAALTVATATDYALNPTRWGSAEVAGLFPGFQHLALNSGTGAFGATAAGFCGGGCDRIEGQRLGSDAITSPASASSRQGETVNGSKSAHWVTQRYMAFGSLDSEIANP
ncbi:MAG: haloacetate dehalogenase [Alphaproteobacteria bacterium]|nr:haloacetate dehalogenase [Alphaproteobacteria bacterium]